MSSGILGLRTKGTQTWAEIGRDSHPIRLDDKGFDKRVLPRLRDIGRAGEESLYSLRLAGELRVWGFRCGNVLEVLWLDPNHEVYPPRRRRENTNVTRKK